MGQVACALDTLGCRSLFAELLGKGRRVPFQPFPLLLGGVYGFVPQLDDGVAATLLSPRDASPERRDFEGIVPPALFALVEAPRDREGG